jgi:hypothetical protein
MGDTGDDDSMLMAKNGLFYKMPQTLSTTVNRTFRREYAQRSSYSEGNTVVFDWNTGTAYVDPANAMLTFSVAISTTGPDAAEAFSFGSGAGACSLIEEIRIISKNGTEIDRIQNANILAKVLTDWTYDQEGQRYLQMALKDQAFAAPATAAERVVIPLRLISGFFRPSVRDMLIPAGLASGLRIEITLATAARALEQTAGAGTVPTYTVTDPEMLMMLHDLNDPTQAVLVDESTKNGLEYTFPSYFATTVNTAATSVNEQVKKAVSNATRAFATAFDVSGGGSVETVTNDGFATIASTQLTNFQYRVGSSYYPQNPIDNDVESWYVTSSCFNKTADTNHPASLSLADFNTGNKFLMGVPLETHSKLNLSGLGINNSSVLELRLNLLNAGGLTRQLVVFMEYTSVARTYVNKTSIKI